MVPTPGARSGLVCRRLARACRAAGAWACRVVHLQVVCPSRCVSSHTVCPSTPGRGASQLDVRTGAEMERGPRRHSPIFPGCPGVCCHPADGTGLGGAGPCLLVFPVVGKGPRAWARTLGAPVAPTALGAVVSGSRATDSAAGVTLTSRFLAGNLRPRQSFLSIRRGNLSPSAPPPVARV